MIRLFRVFAIALAMFAYAVPAEAKIKIFFSPKGGFTNYLVGNINNAKKTIYIMAYSFTSKPIIEALINAHGRKVSIVVVLDRSREKERGMIADILKKAGIPVFIDRKHAIQHSKVMIFDKKLLCTGSFNFSNAAEYHNAENSLGLDDETQELKDILFAYEKEFFVHRDHSVQH